MPLDRIRDILRASLNDKFDKVQDQFKNIDLDWLNNDDASTTSYSSYEDIDAEYERLKREDEQRKSNQGSHQSTAGGGQYGGAHHSKETQYYQDLELPVGANFATIKKQYRKLVKIYHPDLYANEPEKMEMAKKVTLKINEAYRYFSEKEKG